MGKMDEMILVVPRKDVFADETLTFQGVESESKTVSKVMEQIAGHFSEMRRGDAEEAPEFKQPIPYVVIKRKDEVFVYERLSGGGEARLHNKLSLGYGGHMNMEPGKTFDELLKINTDRELEEELIIQETDKVGMTAIGLINDDNTNVGTVHIGILSSLELKDDAEVVVRETEQIRGYWLPITELKKEALYQRLETWSQFVVDILS
jgi:predicted NUDIX family phosphoesterase